MASRLLSLQRLARSPLSLLRCFSPIPITPPPIPLRIAPPCYNLFDSLGKSWGSRGFSHNRVSLVLSEGKTPKFETHEAESSKREKWKTKKRLKLQRKREKEKRKEANRRDPRCIRPKGKKKKHRFPDAVARIEYKIEKVLVRRLARELRVELKEADNGQVAVEYFRQGNACDLVLMDKEMPVMDGHEATRRLRAMGVEIPIIALSGNNLQSDRDLFFQAGADDFVTKPLTKAVLVRLLDEHHL